MATSCEQYITGGDEVDCICGVPSYLVWGIGVVVVLLLLGNMGKIDLPGLGAKLFGGADGFNASYQGASMRGESTQAGVDGFRGRERVEGDDAADDGDDAADDGDDAADDAQGNNGSYGVYGDGSFGGADDAPVQMSAAALKAAHDADSSEAMVDLWARFGGENACEIPIDVDAIAEAVSLGAANGDITEEFDADLAS